MITKNFEKNEKGIIEFTEKELKSLLDEIYKAGYKDGKTVLNTETFSYTSPNWVDVIKGNKVTWQTTPYVYGSGPSC